MNIGLSESNTVKYYKIQFRKCVKIDRSCWFYH